MLFKMNFAEPKLAVLAYIKTLHWAIISAFFIVHWFKKGDLIIEILINKKNKQFNTFILH